MGPDFTGCLGKHFPRCFCHPSLALQPALFAQDYLPILVALTKFQYKQLQRGKFCLRSQFGGVV